MTDDRPSTPRELERRALELLERLEEGRREAAGEVDPLLGELHAALSSGDAARTLGPLIGRLKKARHRLAATPPLGWVAVGGGHLALGHRPRREGPEELRRQGATHLVTLLGESEGAAAIGAAAREAGLEWYWLPMPSARVPEEAEEGRYQEALAELAALLEEGARLYLHCSAGIHRTGMIGFALLREVGYAEEEARALLRELREETAAGVGEERLAWGAALASRGP